MAVIMIKISKILISLFLTIVLLAETATAQMVELKKEKNRVKEELKVAAFYTVLYFLKQIGRAHV